MRSTTRLFPAMLGLGIVRRWHFDFIEVLVRSHAVKAAYR
jgi:hypothetical protein